MAQYLIWSNEHYAWWARGMNGYTPNLNDAGRYDRETAMSISVNAAPQKSRLGDLIPSEMPVLEEDALELYESSRFLPNKG